VFVFSSSFHDFYAPFFICTFGLHSFSLQHIMSYNNRKQCTMTQGPHYEHLKNHKFLKTNSMRTSAILITVIQWCIRASPLAGIREILKTAVRSDRDGVCLCLVHWNQHHGNGINRTSQLPYLGASRVSLVAS
jgi:hypothetical protein